MFERATLRPRGAALLMQPNGISALEAIDPSLADGLMAMDPHMGPYWCALSARAPPADPTDALPAARACSPRLPIVHSCWSGS